MGVSIVGFICVLIVAALLIAWIAYCMFFKERHKSEIHHYSISDLQHKNCQISAEQEPQEKKNKKEITAGIFILPSRHKQKDDDYVNRPDYPESPVPLQPGVDKLIEIFNDSTATVDGHNNKSFSFEVESNVPYHSDV